MKLKTFITNCNTAPHIKEMMPPTKQLWYLLGFSGVVTGEGSESPSASQKDPRTQGEGREYRSVI